VNIPSSIQAFCFADKTVKAFIPSAEWLQQQFEIKENSYAPYWAQVWPAAKALCEVIVAEPELVKDKVVLELAAGLGLPSLYAAQFAKQVISSDIAEEAVSMIKQSINFNSIQNMSCTVMDWNKIDKNAEVDLLLLSDINYDPASFDILYKILTDFIKNGTAVLLSTPQRLLAKSFMEKLQPFCKRNIIKDVQHNEETVFISIWLLEI
jgi:predicted nicotinamide N-methyase